MMTTADSTLPTPPDLFEMIRVDPTDPVSVATVAEIEVLANGYEQVCDWRNYIVASITTQLYSKQLEALQSLIYTLPSRYDLLDRTYFGPLTRWYRSIYTSNQRYDTHVKGNRKQTFDRVAALVAVMKQYKDTYKQALPEDDAIRNQYENLYVLALSSFQDWMDLARPHISHTLRALRAMETQGRTKTRRL